MTVCVVGACLKVGVILLDMIARACGDGGNVCGVRMCA